MVCFKHALLQLHVLQIPEAQSFSSYQQAQVAMLNSFQAKWLWKPIMTSLSTIDCPTLDNLIKGSLDPDIVHLLLPQSGIDAFLDGSFLNQQSCNIAAYFWSIVAAG